MSSEEADVTLDKEISQGAHTQCRFVVQITIAIYDSDAITDS